MRRIRGSLAAACAVALLASLATAASGAFVIASGVRGGTYQRYAANLGGKLTAFRITYRNTKGSGENLELLADGRADVGFAQVDVYAGLMRSEPERFGKIGIVGRLADECVYIAYRKGGRVTAVVDLQTAGDAAKPKLAVGNPNAGMHATWLFMKQIEPAFGATAIEFTEGTLALNHLAAGMIDAVGWVTDPRNHDHKMMRAVQASDDLAILELDDPDLAHDLPNGTRIYELREIALSAGFSAKAVRTICTSSVIFTRPGAEPRLVEAVSDVLSLDRDAILQLGPRP
jgi:hypothetical protein